MKKIVCILFFIVALNACESGPCITKAGDTITDTRQLTNSPSGIYLYDNINLEIFLDTINYIDVSAGANLQGKIITNLSDGNLIIRNDNKCAQFRGFDPNLNVDLHLKDFKSLYYSGFGNLIMKDTLYLDSNGSEDFVFKAENGAGEVALLVNGNVTLDCKETYSKVTLKGENSMRLRIDVDGTSWIHAGAFISKDITVNNNSTGDCIVNPTASLTYSISDVGNINYFGNPAIFKTSQKGKGRLISLK